MKEATYGDVGPRTRPQLSLLALAEAVRLLVGVEAATWAVVEVVVVLGVEGTGRMRRFFTLARFVFTLCDGSEGDIDLRTL